MKRLAIAITLFVSTASAETAIDEFAVNGPPAEDYQLAAQLFAETDENQKYVATCLFYRGQYRARVHLRARPDLPQSGDPALYSSLNSSLGGTINRWAAGNVKKWADAMECALNWAKENDDPFTPKAEFSDVHQSMQQGFETFIDSIRGQADDIKKNREANGLENRP